MGGAVTFAQRHVQEPVSHRPLVVRGWLNGSGDGWTGVRQWVGVRCTMEIVTNLSCSGFSLSWHFPESIISLEFAKITMCNSVSLIRGFFCEKELYLITRGLVWLLHGRVWSGFVFWNDQCKQTDMEICQVRQYTGFLFLFWSHVSTS